MNQLHLAKNGLQRASNRGTRSTSVTNSAAFVTTPIDSADSIHYIVLSAHAHDKFYELVKVVNNASGSCLAATSYVSTDSTGMQSPIESEGARGVCALQSYLIDYTIGFIIIIS